MAYSLAITDLDPLKYDLLFERFLNPGRKSMPDIDMDFSVERRDEVIEYVARKYGRDHVAQIITFGTHGRARRHARRGPRARAALRDRRPHRQDDPRAGAAGDPQAGHGAAAASSSSAYDSDEQTRQVVDLAMALEGLIRNDSIHAAGVVISDQPLTEYIPLQQKGDAEVVTQFGMDDVAALGLLKMDFLGLRNLDVIEAALKLIEKSQGVCIDMTTLPLDDAKTYEMLARGDSTGVFQFESSGMKEALREVGPTAVRRPHRPRRPLPAGPHAVHLDLRPQQEGPGLGGLRPRGPAPHPRAHLRRDHLPGAVHGDRPPGGRLHAGPGRRPAQGHLQEEQEAHGHVCTSRSWRACAPSGLPQNVCNKLWSNFEATGDYSFNKSHAACYALIAYRTAWLKANYPVEYMAAVISSVMNTKDKVPFYVNQCHEMGIEVLPPDVNESDVGFTVVEGKIRFGLNAVKGVGVGAIESIVAARDDGPFSSIYDFCARVDSALVNRRTLEALIKSGAFDSTGDTRRGMLEALPAAVGSRRAPAARPRPGPGRPVRRAGRGRPRATRSPTIRRSAPRSSTPTCCCASRKRPSGLYVSSHPLEGLRAQLRDQIDATVSQLGDLRDGQTVWTGGVISGLARRQTRSGSTMAVFRLDDVDGGIEVVAFGSICEQYGDLLAEDAIVLVRGRLDRKSEDDVKLIALELRPFDGVSAARPLTLLLNADRVQMELLDELKSILGSFPGEVPVVLQLTSGAGQAPAEGGEQVPGRAGQRPLRRAQEPARRELHPRRALSRRARGAERPAASNGRRDRRLGNGRARQRRAVLRWSRRLARLLFSRAPHTAAPGAIGGRMP